RCPGFGIESGRWLRKIAPKLRAMGMDVPSVACIAHLDQTMAVHHELLGGPGRRFLIIEDMDLDHDLTGLHEVVLYLASKVPPREDAQICLVLVQNNFRSWLTCWRTHSRALPAGRRAARSHRMGEGV